ncbi:MAG: MFS transporter [Nocardioidaceae bacterium]|nr:MFS transporter [Nocardioidaceae bacterium]
MSSASLLRERRFRSFFVAHTVSQLGDRVSELAFPLTAVLVLDASAGQVAVLTALVWLPNLAAVFLGAWIDRRPDKKALMVAADLARAALLVTVPLAYAFDAVTLVQLYLVALLTGAFATLFNTTYPAFFVQLVTRERFIDANSVLSASRSASFIAGPAVGGWLVQLLTAPFAILVDAVSFLVSALFVGRVTAPPAPAETADDASPRGLWHQAREGLGFITRHPVLRASLGSSTVVNFFTFASAAVIIVFASRQLGLSAGLIGLALGIGSVGALAGAVLAPSLTSRFGIGPVGMVGAVVFPASIALAAMADGPVWARAAMLGLSEVFSGFCVMLYDVNLNSVMTTVIPDGMRSRVGGAYAAVNYGIRPLGALAGGALGTWVGLRPTLWVAAVGGSLCVLWLAFSPIRSTRTLDDLAPYVGAGVP